MVDLGIHTAFLHGGASVFMCPEILRGGVCALPVVFPVHFFAALVGLQIYQKIYMCNLCVFFLNTGKEAFQLLSGIFLLFLSSLMITTNWIGLVYQIYLMLINNIFPLRWNTFHGWKDGVGSLDVLQISNSCQMPLKWP